MMLGSMMIHTSVSMALNDMDPEYKVMDMGERKKVQEKRKSATGITGGAVKVRSNGAAEQYESSTRVVQLRGM